MKPSSQGIGLGFKCLLAQLCPDSLRRHDNEREKALQKKTC
jgi:hypothetical protein